MEFLAMYGFVCLVLLTLMGVHDAYMEYKDFEVRRLTDIARDTYEHL